MASGRAVGDSRDNDGWLSLSDSDAEEAAVAGLYALSEVRSSGRPHAARCWREKGPQFRESQFSNTEVETLMASIRSYLLSISHGDQILRLDSANSVLWQKGKKDCLKAWPEIAAALPHRTVQACYYAARRRLLPLKKGRWDRDEVAQLQRLMASSETASKWAKIGEEIGRSGEQCRDKWRDLRLGDSQTTGRWSAAEDCRLLELMAVHAPWLNVVRTVAPNPIPDMPSSGHSVAGGDSSDGRKGGVPWKKISCAFGTRTDIQCRVRWERSLSKRPTSGIEKENVVRGSPPKRRKGQHMHTQRHSLIKVGMTAVTELEPNGWFPPCSEREVASRQSVSPCIVVLYSCARFSATDLVVMCIYRWQV
jgi:hypothetical protein